MMVNNNKNKTYLKFKFKNLNKFKEKLSFSIKIKYIKFLLKFTNMVFKWGTMVGLFQTNHRYTNSDLVQVIYDPLIQSNNYIELEARLKQYKNIRGVILSYLSSTEVERKVIKSHLPKGWNPIYSLILNTADCDTTSKLVWRGITVSLFSTRGIYLPLSKDVSTVTRPGKTRHPHRWRNPRKFWKTLRVFRRPSSVQ